MGQLSEKVAIVTGAGAGIGEAYVQTLADNGASVGVFDLDAGRADEVASGIKSRGGSATGLAVDVADASAVIDAVARVESEFGGVDILVNNAGLHLTEYNAPCTTMALDKWRRLWSVNVDGALHCASACVPPMTRRGGGVIINQSSSAGYLPVGAYGVTKAALNGLTLALASELADRSIRVNGIAPGLVDSSAALEILSKDRIDHVVGEQLVPRMGRVADLQGVLMLLCSDQGAFITGETIMVSGGRGRRV